MFICFVGIDGSGKTLQAERLRDRLAGAGYDCEYVWCRYSPRMLRPLVKAAKRMFSGRKNGSEYREFTAAKKGAFKNPALRWFWLNLGFYEYSKQVRKAITSRLKKGGVLVCDRYIHDFLADMAINLDLEGGGIAALLDRPAVKRFPAPDAVFFLDVSPETAFARKDDPNVMGKEYLEERAGMYDWMSSRMGFIRIDGERSVDEISDEVFESAVKLLKGADGE